MAWLLLCTVLAICAGQVRGQAGAELFFDGVDDYLGAFPDFSPLQDWTIEAWVKLTPSGLDSQQCIFHLSTYSAFNIITLEVEDRQWKLRYGGHKLAAGVQQGNAGKSPLVTGEQHHVAITANRTGAGQAAIALYVNGSIVLSTSLALPKIVEPLGTFVVGVCYKPAANGIERVHPYGGHLDEVRYWSEARSKQQINATMMYTGVTKRWPTALQPTAVSPKLEAQYSFDQMAAIDIADTSSKGKTGIRGGWGVANEFPRYQASVFKNLQNGAYFREFRRGNLSCPSSNCVDLNELLGSSGHTGFLVVKLPVAGVHLMHPGNSTPLTAGMFVESSILQLFTEQVLEFGSMFDIRPCKGTPLQPLLLSECLNQPVRTFTFRLLDSRPPTAGLGRSLHLLGEGGYLELRDHLTESGTVEFWTEMIDLDGRQSLFSITHKKTGRPVVSLGVVDGLMTFHFCSMQKAFGEAQPLTLEVQPFNSLDQQHVAFTWEYKTSIRGRAVYELNVYRNCQRVHPKPIEIQDSCVRFGKDDAMLHLPTFGQAYESGLQGQMPGNFAAIHIGDIRLWNKALPGPAICQRKGALLRGTESGLHSIFPITSDDAKRNDATLANHVASGKFADLRCSSVHLICPSLAKSRGYALRPSVFALPGKPLIFVTAAGRIDGVGTYLPPLALELPAFDRDNYEVFDLVDQKRDKTNVKVSSLPTASCGQLFAKDRTTLVQLDQVFAPSELPLYFMPNVYTSVLRVDPNTNQTYMTTNYTNLTLLDQKSCRTNMTYYAIDSENFTSPFGLVGEISVKVPGPRVTSVEIFHKGLSTGEFGPGNIVAIHFDRPTTKASAWKNLFTVVDGSLGNAPINGSWNDVGDVLMLEFISKKSNSSGAFIVPGQTKFKFYANFKTPLTTSGVDSYPCQDLSPAVEGSFNKSYCSVGKVFNKRLARCQACGFGNYRSIDGMKCHPCPPGTFAPAVDSPQCTPCAPGSYLPRGAANRSQCILSSPGKFVISVGESHQVQCSVGMYAEGFGNRLCSRCPDGAVCIPDPGGVVSERAFARPEPGFFRTKTGAIVRCHISIACTGGESWLFEDPNTYCAAGMGGTMCQGCLDGWWRRHDQPRHTCSQCGWTSELRVWIVVAVQIVVVWFLALLTVDAALWQTMHAVIIRLAFNYFTAINLLSRLEAWELEPAMGEYYSKMVVGLFQNTLAFDGGVLAHTMGLECLFGQSYKQVTGYDSAAQWPIVQSQTAFWFFAPLGWVIGLAVQNMVLFELYTMFVKCRHLVKREVIVKLDEMDSSKSDEFLTQDRLLGLVRAKAVYCRFKVRCVVVLEDGIPLQTISYFMLLPTALRELIVVLTCEKLGEDATAYRLLAAPETNCWEGDHLPYAMLAILGIILWGLVVPACVALFLFVHRETLGGDAEMKTHVGFLSDGYESAFVYWEGVVHIRRVAFVIIGMWPGLARASELALYQVVAVVALIVHLSKKPFDNRGGELLDEIELYGLNLFQLLVICMQVVLLADPEGKDYDLVTVFLTCAILCASTTLLCPNLQSFSMVSRIMVSLLFAGMVSLCFMDQKFRHPMAFSLVGLAYVANILFILWLAWQVSDQLGQFMVDESGRMGAKRLAKEEEKKAIQDKLTSETHRRHKDTAQATSHIQMGRLFKSHSKSCFSRLSNCLSCLDASGSGALIYYDVHNHELVLGLHPETYMHDPSLSAYTRRMLARLGPFLTDEEREFVAMSLHDAIAHIIIECDYDKITVHLLEFLIRYTFASHFHKRELLGGTHQEDDDSEVPMVWGIPKIGLTMSVSKLKTNLVDLMFDHEVFKIGITSTDFQSVMMQITMMPKIECEELLNKFLEKHAVYISPTASPSTSRCTSRLDAHSPAPRLSELSGGSSPMSGLQGQVPTRSRSRADTKGTGASLNDFVASCAGNPASPRLSLTAPEAPPMLSLPAPEAPGMIAIGEPLTVSDC